MSAVFGVEVLTLVAFGLLLVGVVGSVVPVLPGALLSLAGVYLYWWHTGYAEPHVLWLVLLTVGGLLAVAFDWLGGIVATSAGGGSNKTSIAAGIVGFLLLFVAGPVGVIVGVAGTVFLLELLRGRETEESLRTAAYATVAVLASSAIQLLVTVSILVVMILVVLI